MSIDTAAPRRGARGGKHLPGKPRTKKPRTQRGFFRRWWWLIVGLPLLGLLVVGGTLVWVYIHLELPSTLPPLQSTYVYDRNGDLLTTFHGAVDRTVIAPSRITDTVRYAILAAEDDAFYQHPGIDPLGIARAAWTDLVKHQTVQGGSTITQQVVKNVYAGTYQTDADGVVTYTVPPRSIGQKVREALLAVKLESEQSKDQILATYLNTIYFGHGAYGIQAAAKTYFGITQDQLNVSQAALLAGIVRSPGFYDPAVKGNEQVAKDRRNYVLDQMVENGWLDATQSTTLKAQKIQLVPSRVTFNTPGDSEYFVDYAKRQLTARYGGAKVFGGGLRVTTSIDLALQRDAEAAVQAHLPSPGDPAAAVVTIDARTGQVLAMVGGDNFAKSQVNLATDECAGCGRQAGSAFKPFTLAAAMADGYDLRQYWSGPTPITIPNKECYTNGRPWTLSNSSDSENGTFTLKDATAFSVNTVFAQVAAQLGPDRVVDMAHALGIRSKLEAVCSITLGTQAVNPLEMTNAYGTLADRGLLTRATPLISVNDRHKQPVPTSSGKPLNPPQQQVLDRNDADLVTSALQGVVDYGTGTAADLGRQVAGKTGTAQEYVDAWFCGYLPAPAARAPAPDGYSAAPQLTTCVWVGYPKNEIPMTSVEGVAPVFGGTIPAAIWHDYMLKAVDHLGIAPTLFPVPSNEGHTKGPATPAPITPSPTLTPSPTETPSPTGTPSPTDSPTPTDTPTDTPTPTARQLRGAVRLRAP